uniref:Uncharacterized protein n=1 Tax=Microviridae sp. ctOkR17 TaxID=2824996 RepID=A0A8S5UFZ8_9VIRU|nr:MAG TPA: hypothetical protein [Microviridae sp. ctOkR17]
MFHVEHVIHLVFSYTTKVCIVSDSANFSVIL